MEAFDTDVLVVGSGAAGLCAAIAAAPRRVLIIAPEIASGSCTELARGGIAAPVSREDSVQAHVADTLRAAAHSGCDCTSRAIIGVARQAIAFLERVGVRFDRDGVEPHLHLEAGHTLPRILHADGDATGAAIHAALLTHARRCAHIQIMSGLSAVALLTGALGVAGVQAMRTDGMPMLIRACETVLATGGLGQLFAATTNGAYATGDGLAMALHAGAAIAGLEFVQFHPTALCCATDPLPLLTEALRGAGAVLRLEDGTRFMPNIDIRAELAPRDIVARAVWNYRQAGHEVLLDAREVFASRRDEFPSADAACRARGWDTTQSPIPVTVAAHFHMGGIRCNTHLKVGQTSLPGLWACGEVACTGLHGANRLASNSLLEAVVMGLGVGQSLARQNALARHYRRRDIVTPVPASSDDPEWPVLRQLMWRYMGPLRDAAGLQTALKEVSKLHDLIRPARLQLRLRLQLAKAMICAALERRESRGAHYRSDFPRRNPRLDGRHALQGSAHIRKMEITAG